MKSINFKKFYKNVKELKTGEAHTLEEKAGRDWTLNIFLFSVIVAAVVVIELIVFINISKHDIIPVYLKDKSSVSVDEKTLNEVVGYFDAKQIRFEELKSEKLNIPDPSI